jgi:hypothetical protein
MIEEWHQALDNAAAKKAHRRIQPELGSLSCNESGGSESPQDVTRKASTSSSKTRLRRHGRGVYD